MKTLPLLIFILLFTLGCSGKKNSSKAMFNIISLGHLTSADYSGGMMLYGKNHDDGAAFSRILSSEADFSFPLDNGHYDFHIIMWDGASGHFTGDAFCGNIQGIILNGGETPINIYMSKERCANQLVNGASVSINGNNDLAQLDFRSCTDNALAAIITFSPNDCTNGNAGDIQSFKISLLEYQGDKSSVNDYLTSECISSFDGTGLRFPTGNGANQFFATKLQYFSDTSCGSSLANVIYPNSLSNPANPNDTSLFYNSAGTNYLLFDDIGLPGSAAQGPSPFVSTWQTTTAAESITLPLRSGYNYNFTVDWGDGSPADTVTSDTDLDKTHTYASPGTYNVSITGTVEAWFFNNSGDKDKIISVTDLGDMGWLNLENAFWGCSNMTSFAGGNTANVTSMGSMFRQATLLNSLDLSSFDTALVTDMGSMFKDSPALTSLDLSGFDTSSVINMSAMFLNASGLSNLNLSGLNTANVNTMQWMFQGASSLTSLDLSSFNTSSVTDMSFMFRDASSLTSLDLSGFNTTNVTKMNWMFYNASNLPSLDLSIFDTSSVTDMSFMFYGTTSLNSLDLSSFNTANVTTMQSMFYSASSLASMNLSHFNTTSVTNMSNMFRSTASLTALDTTGWDISSAGTSTDVFTGANIGLSVSCDQGGLPGTGSFFGKTCY